MTLPGARALVLLGILLCGCTEALPAPADPTFVVPDEVPAFVSTAVAARSLGHPSVRFVDARPHRQYARGHIPGAVRLGWDEFTPSGTWVPTGLLADDREESAERLSALGLSDDQWIIVVGDPLDGAGEDGRIAWMLADLGHPRTSVLDGGWPLWVAEGRAVSRRRVTLEPGTFVAGEGADTSIEGEELMRWLSDPRRKGRKILDVRSHGEYIGDDGVVLRTRRGHIPTAKNLPFRDLLDEKGRVLSAEGVRAKLETVGVTPEDTVALYCTGGVRSAHTWWVLRSAGYAGARSYAGSLWEWSLDRSRPLVRGEERVLPGG